MNKTLDGDYEQLRLIKAVDDANKLLKAGWLLVDTYSQVRGDSVDGTQIPGDCYMNYVLGWHRSKGTLVDVNLPPQTGCDL